MRLLGKTEWSMTGIHLNRMLICFCLLAFISAFQEARASIAVENTQSSSSAGTTLSWTHAVGSGANRFLIVGVSARGITPISSITYDGINLSFVGAQNCSSSGCRVEIWQLVAPPTDPSGTISVSTTGTLTPGLIGGSISFTGVDLTTPLGAFASNAGISGANVTVSSAPGEFVVDTFASNMPGPLSAGTGQTERWKLTIAPDLGGGGSTKPGATSVDMSWDSGGSPFPAAIGALSIKPATGMSLTVTNTNDSGPGSLRQAILDANANPGPDSIRFVLGTGNPAITLTSTALPTITDTVTIAGDTGGATRVQIVGSGPVSGSGLTLGPGSDGSTLRSLIIRNFTDTGLTIQSSNNSLRNNYIGIDATGAIARANGGGGVSIDANANNNTIGGTTVGAANLISGNSNGGVQISGNGNLVQGNFIGTNADTTSAVGNVGNGLSIVNGSNNTIGGDPLTGVRNVISGNSGTGVFITGNTGGTGNLVQGNFIGHSSGGVNIGNLAGGVVITGAASGNTIGGVGGLLGNTIAFNNLAGVQVVGASATGNAIRANSIFSNTGLGIDLVGGTEDVNGVTANDPCDGDTGPNNLQNFPVLTFSGGTLSGTLNSAPNTTFTIDFFSSPAPDNSGYGEGQMFQRSLTVTTDVNCNATFNDVRFPSSVPAGQWITATATDSNGNTSEFSQAVQLTTPTGARASISGQVTTVSGAPLGGVVLTLDGSEHARTITDANGRYQFTGVEIGGFYTLSPTRANYNFAPLLRSLSLVADRHEEVFIATHMAETATPIDTDMFFVRQQYLDFLNREPDAGGLEYWTSRISQCGDDLQCVRSRRIGVSAAFFIEQEFQNTGFFVYRVRQSTLGVRPSYLQYVMDRNLIRVGAEQDKAAFTAGWVQRPEFLAKYPAGLSGADFIDALLKTVRDTSGVDLSDQRAALINDYNLFESRARIVRAVAESSVFEQAEYNRAFVLAEYFGYLRRNPDPGGYNFWLSVLNNRLPNDPSGYRGMVCAFITSARNIRTDSVLFTRTATRSAGNSFARPDSVKRHVRAPPSHKGELT